MALLSRQHDCVWFVFYSQPFISNLTLFSPCNYQVFSINDRAEAHTGLLHITLYSWLLMFHKSHLNNWILVEVCRLCIGSANTCVEKEVERSMCIVLWIGRFIGSISYPMQNFSLLAVFRSSTNIMSQANVKDVLSGYFILVLLLICTYIISSSLSLLSSY